MATSLVSGAVVSKVDYVEGDDPTRTDYTLVRAGGKLTKHTRQTRTLASVDKIRLSTWWAMPPDSTRVPSPTPST